MHNKLHILFLSFIVFPLAIITNIENFTYLAW